MITYELKLSITGGQTLRVLLDGKAVGEIRYLVDGFQYFPKGSKTGGEVFKKLGDCKRSLES